MKLYTNISYGVLKPVLRVAGATAIAEDSGRGQFFGVGTGVSCFDVPDSEVVAAFVNNKPWPAVNPVKCQQYFSKLARTETFVSNICEGWERDAGQVDITATFLAYAKARRLKDIGHYGFPNLPRFYSTRQEWRDTNDRAMDAWRGSLTMLNPSFYARPEVASNPTLDYASHIELDELALETIRLAKRGREKLVGYISHQAYDGRTILHYEQLQQRIGVLQAFGFDGMVVWSDQAGDAAGRLAALAAVQVLDRNATYQNAQSEQ